MSEPSIDPSSAAPAGLSNTRYRFGAIAKGLHWLMALLILTMLASGVVAYQWPYDTSEALAVKGTLFSLHKTLGLFTFAVALVRIAWAIAQPRPAMVPIDSKAQEFAAAVVHWSLYGALVLVPLSGWTHHAASTGFAPIWWPFGQTLFFVPQSPELADMLGMLHFVFIIVLVVSLVLHIGGALKHHVIDRDATLRRMLPGNCDLPDAMPRSSGHVGPAFAALGIWAMAVVIGIAQGPSATVATAASVALTEVPSEWAVQSGTLSLDVLQFGQSVTGEFANWTAAIDFSQTAIEGQHGSVEVTISVPSLTLGSITDQALADDFLAADSFMVSTFAGPILADGDGFVVDGTINLIGQSHPLLLPFSLTLEGDVATASGTTMLDRRTLGMGSSYGDEGTVGFSVGISFELTALRGSADAG